MPLPIVVATRQLPPKAWNELTAQAQVVCWESDCPVTREWLLDHIPEADGLYCLLTDRIDEEVLRFGKRLRVVSTMSVGYDHIDIPMCDARSIPVGHTPGILTETTADLAFALLMTAARRIVEGAEYVRQGHWAEWKPDLLLGQDIFGATLGIVGFGRIGQAVARRARGFHMNVLAVRSPRQNRESPESSETAGIDGEASDIPPVRFVDLPTALAQSDFVSLHVPLTFRTQHMIGEPEFQMMKGSSILINTARGAVVDHAALYAALQQGTIGGAALDVTEPEPLPASHPLLTLHNCLVIPHLGSASTATRARMADMAVENVIAGLRGDRLPHCVNPEVYQ
jgi:glyoxylate reductase